MRRKWMVFGIAAAVSAMSLQTGGAVFATSAETEVQTEAAAADSQEAAADQSSTGDAADDAKEDAEILEAIQVSLEGEEPLLIANTAKLAIRAASVEAQDAAEGETEAGQANPDAAGTGAQDESATLVTIELVGSEGESYLFLDVPYAEIGNPELIKKGAFVFLKYTSLVSEKEHEIPQEGELTYENAVEQFAVDDVYIRKEPSDEAEILGVISRGDAIEVLGETATHYQVKKDEVIGYAVRRCISEDEQEAIAAVQANEAELQAQAAQQAPAQQSPSGDAGGVYEVSRQRFDDCDGSGHGYYLITYSDGSTATEEY